MAAKLAHQTQKTAGIPNGMRTATIVAVTSSSVTISVNGGQFSAGVGVVTSYAPVVGDVVAVFRQDSSWLILGPTASANPWQSMAALGYQNGWTNLGTGFAPGQFRRVADEVQVVGNLTNASVVSNNSIIVAGLPAPPVQITTICAQTTNRVRIYVDTSGNLKVTDITASGSLQFAFSYWLDVLTS